MIADRADPRDRPARHPRPPAHRHQQPCGECFGLLDAHVELARGAAAEMPFMRAHLRGCSACRDDYESLLTLLLEP